MYAAIKYLCGLYMCVMTPVIIISVWIMMQLYVCSCICTVRRDKDSPMQIPRVFMPVRGNDN